MKTVTQRCDRGRMLEDKPTGAEIRACEASSLPIVISEFRRIFPVNISSQIIGGVRTDVIVPVGGQARGHRVLINLHGGAFMIGSHFHGLMESIPVASVGSYEVITVDYSMAPEHRYPAATFDVVRVYQALLESHQASQIGIFGCSAGAVLVGQVVAYLNRKGLPRPGAVSVSCAAPSSKRGDSGEIWGADGARPAWAALYMNEALPRDPLAYPADFDRALAKFPPTLLMTSTRDVGLSSVVVMHERLTRLGVAAELHVFEGFGHAEFLYNPYVPEIRDAALITARFFNTHLVPDTPVAPLIDP